MAAFGFDADYAALAADGTGALWVAAGRTPDGAARVGTPPAMNAALYSYLAGDDRIRSLTPFASSTGTSGMWLGTDGNGLLFVADVTAPATADQWASTNGRLPSSLYDRVRGGAFDDASGDAWFATEGGLVRYKADVGAMAVIPPGQSGLGPFGDSSAVLFDEGNGRPRTLYYATRRGVYRVTGG